jgi:ubiquinone/menaquinone biosynthesis C-methylase UbiE
VPCPYSMLDRGWRRMTQDPGMDLAAFRHVDSATNPAALIRFLDMAKGHPVLTELQTRLAEELRLTPGAHVLDAGCGTGTRAVEIARTTPGVRITGVDASRLMVEEAHRRSRDNGLDVSYHVADAAALPFGDDAFDACQAQTLLEHVADPAAVLAELVRVTRPDGRIAALDLDQGSTVLDHPDRAATRMILDDWTDAFAGGWVGRSLHRLFLNAGLEAVSLQIRVAEFGAPFFRALLAGTTTRLAQEGRLPGDVLEQWWRDLDERAAREAFFGASLWFLATGTVPG